MNMLWDVFISHASEDKADVARPLQHHLEQLGLRVWLDENQLKIGDSLSEKINAGLSQSRFGIVILSPFFFAKKWTQRELDELIARGTGSKSVILPILHNMSHEEVAQYSAWIADRTAPSTNLGLSEVATKIYEVAGSYLDPTRVELMGRYKVDFSFPVERLCRAIEAINSLCLEHTWKHLLVTNNNYPYRCWMGSDSSALIEILYQLAAPLIEFRQSRYALKRSLYTFSPPSRILYSLLESALDLIGRDSEIANLLPAIKYTPRVEGWREKRQQNPVRYWWQGVEQERFERAIPYFLNPETSSGIIKSEDFREVYQQLYAHGNTKDQQALGVLANPLYNFTPATRPVFWRMLICWAQIYQAALGNTQFDCAKMGPEDAHYVFTPMDSDQFPYTLSLNTQSLYEPYPNTLNATSYFLRSFIAPRIAQYLSLEREVLGS
ncbi:MAG: toll/interleukin-1 receptor domain-containing protein [Cytophagales bacterium]|nr:toll/interleukin-1 receptor domain-containing protein [Cytophagales bacterium]